VDDLFVRPDCRCHGLATSALAAVRRACETDGVRALLVETSLSTEPAVRVYRRVGFAETGRLLLTLPLASALHEPSA
jgi:ribosomal protein S18 acetylase RimI-like enzyme